jgi:hypothetical protein
MIGPTQARGQTVSRGVMEAGQDSSRRFGVCVEPSPSGPTRKISVRLVPDARTVTVGFLLVSLIWASMQRRSPGNSAAARSGSSQLPGRRDRGQDASSVSCGDLLGDPAGDELAEHRMQPPSHLCPRPAKVAVVLGPHLEDRGVIARPDLPPGARAKRRDGGRAGVVGVVFVGVPGATRPSPSPLKIR